MPSKTYTTQRWVLVRPSDGTIHTFSTDKECIENGTVYVDGKPGRIIRVGITKTVFFIYDVIDGQVVGGSKLVIQNEYLGKLKIEKPLCQLDLTRYNGKKKH